MKSAVFLTVLLAGACLGGEPLPAKGILDPELRDVLAGNATETKDAATNSSSAPPPASSSTTTTTTTTEKAKKADDDDGPNLV